MSGPPDSITYEVRTVLDWLFGIAPEGPQQLDREVEQAARLLFLDTLGCAIGGAAKPELQTLNQSLATLGPGSVHLPGMTHALAPSAAASWCAMAATWDEACEGLARAHGRPGLHSFPAAVALTLGREGTLGDALVALVRGYEIAGRLGERLRIKPDMHVDGTWGTFGAVAAAGSALGHGAETVMAAVEAAACQTPFSLYLPVAQGATIRNSYVAEASSRAIGLCAAVEAGVTTPVGGLDLLADRLLDAGGPDARLAPAGEWLILQGYLKPFAAVRHVHYGAEAAKRWRKQGQPSSAITEITLDVYPEAVTYCGNRAPTSPISAQFSLTFGIARMLSAGTLDPSAYIKEGLADSETLRLERLIEVNGTPGQAPDQRYATLRIRTADGQEETLHVDQVVGDATSPMGVDDVAAKFTDYTQWLGADWPAAEVVAAVLEGSLETPLATAIGSR